MRFHTHQAKALTNTKKILIAFFLLILAINSLLAVGIHYFLVSGELASAQGYLDFLSRNPENLLDLLAILGFLVAFAFLVSSFKSKSLGGGGGARVAESLGGREVNSETQDPYEIQLMQVVEEMAIAAHAPMPRVFIMDQENAINAFAAGSHIKNAVIGVTRGCITKLNRDQLQGVIAHEFSHIVHGDMKLNMSMIGFIFSLVFILIMGQIVFRSGLYSSLMGGSRNSGNARFVLLGLGIALIVIGFVGKIASRILQSMINRQREYLADASAVKYTRNPQGIAYALLKIGRDAGQIASPQKDQYSHFMLSNSRTSFLSNLFATHPPLEERVELILGKGFEVDEDLMQVPRLEANHSQSKQSQMSSQEKLAHILPILTGDAMQDGVATSQGKPLNFRELLEQHIQKSLNQEELVNFVAFAEELKQDPGLAKSCIVSLCLNESLVKPQASLIQTFSDEFYTSLQHTRKRLLAINQLLWLEVYDRAVETYLKAISPREQTKFAQDLFRLIQLDSQVDFFEWGIFQLLLVSLGQDNYCIFPQDPSRVAADTSLPHLVNSVLKQPNQFNIQALEGKILLSAQQLDTQQKLEVLRQISLRILEDRVVDPIELLIVSSIAALWNLPYRLGLRLE